MHVAPSKRQASQTRAALTLRGVHRAAALPSCTAQSVLVHHKLVHLRRQHNQLQAVYKGLQENKHQYIARWTMLTRREHTLS